ncbi:uncharacterized protein LOC118461415 isoform X2 [Anopheles albimanus]|uniref:uncharacterized protein LOC118461415 isoform X2 n=1 Tax=Anopheles albimanus TaxID=7167 RepID=UPI001640A7A1|nr:uncharacterized protein LOC118461415 isoform X2 [Anopheles albimanus]
MASSLHHGNMDHLEHQDEHELKMNLSKELLRSGMAAVESSAIQFIESAPVGNHTREQEYIESSLLGTDLLSSHLPTHMLNDYITSVPCSSSGTLNSLQPTMLEHHYRTFLSDDLQSLVEVTGIQPVSDPGDRKLFQQYGNKSSTNPLGSSNETAVIVTGSKEIPSFGTITTYDKLLNMAQPPSPIPGGLAQISGAIDGYVHFALTGGETYDLIGNSITTSHHHPELHDVHNPYGLHHLHHHTQHHHHQQQQQQHTQNAKELPVMVNTSIALGQSFIPCSQSSLQPSDASTMKMLSNTIIPATTTIAEPAHLHDGTTLSIPPLRSQPEHSKSYYSSSHLPSFLTSKDRSNVSLVDATVLNDIGSEVSDTEARIEEADTDCLTSMDISSQTMPLTASESINLPHKKRLSKKLGDTKDTSSSGEPNPPTSVSNETRVTVIATESTALPDEASPQPTMLQSGQIQPDDSNTTKSVESLSRQESATIVCFSCQLCGQLFQDQLLFFTHLKTHYEPENTGSKKDADVEKRIDLAESIDASQLEGKKPKPKLPRVKHTKMLKTDRVFKDSITAEPTPQNYESENNVTSGPMQTKPLLSCTQSASISNGIELDSGEFSETEDMLEGIRNVVQQTVDKDPAEDSCFNLEAKQWFTSSVAENTTECINDKQTMVAVSTVDGSATTIPSCDASTNVNASTSSFDMLFNKSQLGNNGLVETLETTHYQPLQTAPILELQQSDKCDLLLEPIEPKSLMDSDGKTAATGSPVFLAYASNLVPSMEEISEPFVKVQEVVPHHTDPSQVASIRCIPLPNLRNSVEGHDGGSADHTQTIYTNITPAADAEKEQTATSMEASLDDAMEEDSYLDEDNECDSEELENLSANEHEPVLDQTEENAKQSNRTHVKGKRKSRKVQLGDGTGATGHSQTKTTKYLCQVDGCGRQFNSNTAFQYHRLQHTGERPHKCTVCGKCFITCSALKVHERLHSGEKPYKCDQCGHCFRQWGDLKYHNISIHSNEKSHKCEFCGKQFARRYSLSLHRRIHTNEKNFICEYCNKGFRASTYLQTHRRIHTGEKPHQCTICDKKFRCHGDINRHLKTHERLKGKGKPQGQAIADTDDAPKVSQQRSNVIDLTKSKPKRAKKAAAKANTLD